MLAHGNSLSFNCRFFLLYLLYGTILFHFVWQFGAIPSNVICQDKPIEMHHLILKGAKCLQTKIHLLSVHYRLEPLPVDIWREVGYTADRSRLHPKTDVSRKKTHLQESLINQTSCVRSFLLTDSEKKSIHPLTLFTDLTQLASKSRQV